MEFGNPSEHLRALDDFVQSSEPRLSVVQLLEGAAATSPPVKGCECCLGFGSVLEFGMVLLSFCEDSRLLMDARLFLNRASSPGFGCSSHGLLNASVPRFHMCARGGNQFPSLRGRASPLRAKCRR